MRIYDGDFTVARLIEDCSRPRRESGLPVEGQVEPREIDLHKLNARLAELPIREIRRRRARMNKFYEEVLVSSDHDRGIAFTSLLMILAHYKVINDNKSLRFVHPPSTISRYMTNPRLDFTNSYADAQDCNV
jgi:hypothetical protein